MQDAQVKKSLITGSHSIPELSSIGMPYLPTYVPFPPWHSLAVLSAG